MSIEKLKFAVRGFRDPAKRRVDALLQKVEAETIGTEAYEDNRGGVALEFCWEKVREAELKLNTLREEASAQWAGELDEVFWQVEKLTKRLEIAKNVRIIELRANEITEVASRLEAFNETLREACDDSDISSDRILDRTGLPEDQFDKEFDHAVSNVLACLRQKMGRPK